MSQASEQKMTRDPMYSRGMGFHGDIALFRSLSGTRAPWLVKHKLLRGKQRTIILNRKNQFIQRHEQIREDQTVSTKSEGILAWFNTAIMNSAI